MNDRHGIAYESPVTETIEVKSEGIICESVPSFEEGFDED